MKYMKKTKLKIGPFVQVEAETLVKWLCLFGHRPQGVDSDGYYWAILRDLACGSHSPT